MTVRHESICCSVHALKTGEPPKLSRVSDHGSTGSFSSVSQHDTHRSAKLCPTTRAKKHTYQDAHKLQGLPKSLFRGRKCELTSIVTNLCLLAANPVFDKVITLRCEELSDWLAH